MIKGHGGNIYKAAKALGCSPFEIIDMSSNVNPLGMPSGLEKLMRERLPEVGYLPEVDNDEIQVKFAASMRLGPDKVLAGNGTTEFIYTTPLALKAKKVLILGPTYSDYADACLSFGIKPRFLLTSEDEGFKPNIEEISAGLAYVDTAFICNPNNPTGQFIPSEDLKKLIRDHPDVRFVVDESYLPFLPDWESESLMGFSAKNVIVLHSFSKIFSIPGLRLGFLIAEPNIVEKFLCYGHPWSVNRLAQAAGEFLLSQKTFIRETTRFVTQERQQFLSRLRGLDMLKPFAGAVHFILLKLNGTLRSYELFDLMSKHGIIIRDCSNFYGLSDLFVRIAMKDSAKNKTCIDILRSVLV